MTTIKAQHPYQTMIEKLRRNRSKNPRAETGAGYTSLSDFEKRLFHADVYAFRRVYLDDVSDTSPTDPNSEFFNEDLIQPAEKYYRGEIARQRKKIHDRRKFDSEQTRRQGRDIVNKWAQKQGFADMDDYTRRTFGEPGDPADSNANWFRAYQVYLAEFKAKAYASDNVFPLRRDERLSAKAKQRLRDKSLLRQAQEDLGISATESESKP